jgi:peptide/nickel transport system ATP-binding protein
MDGDSSMTGHASSRAVDRTRDAEPLLRIDSLSVEYDTDEGALRALRDVSLDIEPGETYGLAGESGSGKSTLALSILRYLGKNGEIASGTLEFDGDSLLDLSPKQLRSIRGNRIAHVPQDPKKSLNPSIRVGKQIAEAILLHQDVSKQEARQRVYDLLEQMNIPDPEYNFERYPHELSGGMQQRVLLAMALSCNPELLILDEPTTGLDVTTEAKILDLISELKAQYNTSILLITHDLGVISEVADRIGILYAGEMMEEGPIEDVFTEPAHPYTQGLLAAIPEVGVEKRLAPIPGRIPDLTEIPTGCIFADRCAFADEQCRDGPIAVESVRADDQHTVRCRRWEAAREDPITADYGARDATVRGETVLEVRDLHKQFGSPSLFQRYFGEFHPVKAVSGVDFDIHESETLAIVGESGCGKSTLAKCLVRLLSPTGGTIRFRGTDVSSLAGAELATYHADVGIVFQNPDSTLNPRKTIFKSVSRPLELFTDMDKSERKARVAEMLEEVGLDEEYALRYPHELSGGEQQRVAIARAFISNPSFVVLDEPVSALDVSIQASILDLLASLRDEYGTSYLLISHDLSVVNYISDRIGVMYLGELVELGRREDVFAPPHHPYTRALLSSIPSADLDRTQTRIHLEGDVPSAREPPSGCSFHTRCPQKIGDVCTRDTPALEGMDAETAHQIACHLDAEEMSVPNERITDR